MSAPDPADAGGGTPGWYGKLPSTGDFASRRLSHGLIEAWDGWLAQEIGELRQQYPDQWLQAYLDSPTWRFVLGAGMLGEEQTWPMAGVLMPSIDRVGRYFPLTVAQVLAAEQSLADIVCGPDDWFEQTETLLLDTLEPDARFEVFEAAVQGYVARAPGTAPIEHFAGLQRLAATQPDGRALALAACACEGASLWWGRGSERIAAGLMRCSGLPQSSEFGRFLLGKEAVR